MKNRNNSNLAESYHKQKLNNIVSKFISPYCHDCNEYNCTYCNIIERISSPDQYFLW